jgi:hypothetical protein
MSTAFQHYWELAVAIRGGMSNNTLHQVYKTLAGQIGSTVDRPSLVFLQTEFDLLTDEDKAQVATAYLKLPEGQTQFFPLQLPVTPQTGQYTPIAPPDGIQLENVRLVH